MENKEDLKKYFDSKEYVTKIIGSEEESNELPEIEPSAQKDSKIDTLISLLTDPQNKDVKEETLLTLKKDKGEEVLLKAIATQKAKDKQHLLVAACWESEINFSKYLPFFVLLALSPDYLVSLEAITTIENMEGPFEPDAVKNAILKIKAEQKKITDEKAVLLNDLVMTLENYLA
ncbi:MAG: hypothetical protein M3R27_11375 [Bacteroidota bacterium]|nr:hypothetical protein [Bacteroidota bacterium]